MAYRDIILSKTIEYVRHQKLASAQNRAIVMIDCPYCNFVKAAQIIPTMATIKCVHCGTAFNLIDLIRHTENRYDDSEETILNYVRDLLKIDVQTTQDAEDVSKILKVYSDRGWALVPCAKADAVGHTGEKVKTGKEVIQAEWQKKENRNASEWFHWINSGGLNIGVRTGVVSNLTIIDFDLLTKEEKADLVRPGTSKERIAEIKAKKAIPDEIKAIMGTTLMQESHGGIHLFYTYCPELRKTSFNYNGIHIDIENDLGQVIIPPSQRVGVEEEFKDGEDVKKRIVGHAGRRFINDVPMIAIPPALLTWLQEKIKPIEKKIEYNPELDVETLQVPENFKVKDLQGNRNNTLLALGGIFRKELNIKNTNFVLNVLNKHLLESPLPTQEIQHIVEGLTNYVNYDEQTLGNEIVSYLKETDTASKAEIEAAIFGQKTTTENKKRFDKTLMMLVCDEKISKKNARDYKFLHSMEWNDNILNVGQPIKFKMPYFGDYANFNEGDLILVGAVQKYGKTSLSMNFVERLVKQGIKPHYIYSESGGRFATSALKLGLKDGDFYRCRCSNPDEIILKPNSIYIYDWIRPRDFAKTDELFEKLVDKIDKSNSIMIGFVQLREGSEKNKNQNDWFAKDLIRQHVALSAKYLYEDKEGVNTYLELDDIRDSKTYQKHIKVPCKYIRETREVKMLEEIDREEAEKKRAALIVAPTVTPDVPVVEPVGIPPESPKTADQIKFDPADR